MNLTLVMPPPPQVSPRNQWVNEMTWAMANPASVRAYRIKRRERAHMTNLRRLSPRDWILRIRTVPLPQRADVARIIWWDYFSRLPEDSPAAHLLDRFFDDPPSDPGLIIEGLITCGYSPWQAITRL